MTLHGRWFVGAAIVLALVGSGPGVAAEERTFDPRGSSEARFPPAGAPHDVSLDVDGDRQHGRLWRPDTSTDPSWRPPLILVASIYAAVADSSQVAWLVERFTPRGYAVLAVELPGSGGSEGCFDFFGPVTEAAVTAWVETAASLPWSNGRVGVIGFSADGEAGKLAAVAAPAGLATVVAIAASSGVYDGYSALDGVPFNTDVPVVGPTPVDVPSGATIGAGYAALAVPGRQPRDPSCHGASLAALSDPSGDRSPWFRAREFRNRASSVAVPVLTWQSWRDPVVLPAGLVDWVDRLPARSRTFVTQDPAHRLPQDADGIGTYPRWPDVLHAWLDEHVLGVPTGTSAWPRLQAQGEDGSWRAAASFDALARTVSWPLPGAGHPQTFNDVSTATWTSAPVAGAVHLSGEPSIVLEVSFDHPDAHVVYELTERRPDGSTRTVAVGAGSVPHLLGTVDAPLPVPIGERLPLRVRGWPVDATIAPGSRLQLVVSSSHPAFLPSASPATGTVVSANLVLPHARRLPHVVVVP